MLPEQQTGLPASAPPDTWWARLRRFHRSAVFLTYGFTALRLVGFIIVMPVALRLLPPAQIGLWYVFTAIGGLCAIAELGFAPVIGRHASYYSAGAVRIPELGLPPGLNDGKPNLAGLSGLVQMAGGLYLKLALLVATLMLFGGGGWLVWQHGDAMVAPLTWVAFLVYVAGNAIGMAGMYWPALLFGINEVHAYQRTFILGLVLNYAVVFLGLLSGLGLLALVLGQVVLLLFPRWLARRLFLQQIPLGQQESAEAISWQQLWPMTWRAGLATFGSFLCLQSTTLICAQVLDLERTASYSLSLQLALVGYSLGNAWLLVKFPEISALRAQGRWAAVRVLVGQRVALGVLTYGAASFVAWAAAPPLLRILGSRTPLLDPIDLALLMVMVGCDLVVGSHSAVLQTGNRVPQLKVLLWSGIITVATAFVLGILFGIRGIILAPVAAQLPLNYWWTPRCCWRELRSAQVAAQPSA